MEYNLWGGGWRARHLKYQIQKFEKLHYLKISKLAFNYIT